MFLLPIESGHGLDELVLSPSDIVSGAACEFGAMRALDILLERLPAPERAPDPMGDMLAEQGERHERRHLEKLRSQSARPERIYEADTGPVKMTRQLLHSRHTDTLNALTSGDHDVIYQGSLFDRGIHGRTDFLIREPDGSWAINDTKLARSAKARAKLQLAAYADQLLDSGVPVARQAHLVLGNGEISSHDLEELLSGYRSARDSLLELLEEHRATEAPAGWKDARWRACLDCESCKAEMAAADDLMLVGRMNRSRRTKLIGTGITTLTEFAAAEFPDADRVLKNLHAQARLQAGIGETDGSINGVDYKIQLDHSLHDIPAPVPGDIFFDFEGDPGFEDPEGGQGLEYLFGLLETSGPRSTGLTESRGQHFRTFTAHTRAQEKQALIDFMAHVAERRKSHPGLHIYHYAPYEVTALRKLAARHGILADDVEELVAEGVLFDLYKTVKKSLWISDRSLSIKALEPLYMPEGREGVATAVDSIIQYSRYRAAAEAGETAEADDILGAIVAYNEYDCRSTLLLRDWLLGLQERHMAPHDEETTSPRGPDTAGENGHTTWGPLRLSAGFERSFQP